MSLSNLHKDVLKQLVAVRAAKGWTLVKFMQKAGLSKQTFNGWQHGSSPTLESLEACAGAVGGTLYVRILTQAEGVTLPSQRGGPDLRTEEAAEIATMVDGLDDPGARAAVLEGAYMAHREYNRRKAANPQAPAGDRSHPSGPL